MTHDPLREVDRRLRETFEPDAVAVARVVAGAASAGSARRRRRLLRLAWAAAALFAVGGTAAFWHSRSVRRPEPPELVLSGSFTDDVLVLSAPDGSLSLSGPGARDDRPPDGYGIVLVEGDLK